MIIRLILGVSCLIAAFFMFTASLSMGLVIPKEEMARLIPLYLIAAALFLR